MERKSRRHSTGFGYIGFGNNQNVFNQYTTKAFSSLKEKLNKETHLHFQLDFLHKTLSKEEKNIIKNKIRKQEKQKTLKALVFSFILLIIVLFFIKLLISNIMARF
ncbi:hypothetical protein SAMN05428642_10249 [Flaviramulus basaltis]|uniref:Uncharacterized protein n=1 Tax=Flaviramulus basaltis TaxID=369401 RepID=A0A1K2IG72_9FLAO|nr:hypothetical protein [Flaviramulus basaltis]SFZ91409.1 hypothetical protein SAMN05428642_10249 [Flaviramulus basaltis]